MIARQLFRDHFSILTNCNNWDLPLFQAGNQVLAMREEE